MSSSATPTPDRDQQMLSVGRQCAHPSCHLVDFLPFKCQHCAESFCADHFKPASHTCPRYDETKFNRVAPDCPLCNEPVPIPPGEDPNIRMERHLTVDCSVMTGRSRKANATPKCSKPKCGKVLIAQIQCDKCRQKFCQSIASRVHTTALPSQHLAPLHRLRHTEQSELSGLCTHRSCVRNHEARRGVCEHCGIPIIGQDPRQGRRPFVFREGSSFQGHPILGAVASSSKSVHNPFSKTDRRSKQEKESQLRAMRARAQKGLLSEDEKVILASLEAERAHGHGDKDCVVM
ncbi:hypothetical protein BC834DRAFT_904193 [Gloeopeniophorella convolvens]|nr:hypothetical protein BC834DRAFT_904193 [Gloeopeniophorella convolvens]